MTRTLAHRGPDDEGTWSDPDAGIYLGFRRLSILDLSQAGHQPMSSSSGRFVVTFNGEIYNFRELRSELEGQGARFRGHSDTEVLLAGVEAWGVEQAVRRFRGMFALAIWDSIERRLFLARDRMGIKPLYLLSSPGGFAWASECRAFHRCPLFSGRGDPQAAWHFLRRLYVPGPLSILEGVEKLAPGEIVCIDAVPGGPRIVRRTRFWDLPELARDAGSRPVREEEVVDRLHELVRESVRLRMVADVPVGAFLSGGIDSSVVVSVMQELASEPVRTFTISFDDPDFDEGPVANAVAEMLGTRHTSVAFPAEEVLALIPALPELSDEPMANPSLLPTLLVSRVARRDVVVALSGDGGDELFGGYNRYLHGAGLIRRTHALPRMARRVTASLARSGVAAWGAEALLRVRSPASVGRQQSVRERLAKVAGVLEGGSPQEAYEALLAPGMEKPPFSIAGPGASLRPGLFGSLDSDLESCMMLLDQMEYLPDDLLAKVDRASMWESLEARVPLLDQEVVKFSWTVATASKIRGGETKWPLRRIAARYLPETILQRPKMGFTVPIARWLSGELREWARDTLSGGGRSGRIPWNEEALQATWRAFENGRSDLALPLWAAAVLQAWTDAWTVSFR